MRLHSPPGFGRRFAQVCLALSLILAFNVFRLTGIASLASGLLLLPLAAVYIRTPGARVPRWELVLVAVIALSVFWSDLPPYTTERLRTYLPVLLVAITSAAILTPRDVLRSMRWGFAVIIGSSLLTLLLDPSSRMRGAGDFVLTAQFPKNVYGGLLVATLVLVLEQRRSLTRVVVPVLLVLIALNQSVTAWLVAALLTAISASSRAIVRRVGAEAARPLLATLIICSAGAVVLLLSAELDQALGLVGKDPTLGSRTRTWALCWEQIKTAPLLGHGAFTFLNSASDSPVTQFVWAQSRGYFPPHPHNGLIDLAGQVGLIGTAAFLALVGSSLRRGLGGALAGLDEARTAVLGILFLVMYGLTEPSYLGPWLVLSIGFAAMAGGTRPSLPVARAPEPRTSPAHHDLTGSR